MVICSVAYGPSQWPIAVSRRRSFVTLPSPILISRWPFHALPYNTVSVHKQLYLMGPIGNFLPVTNCSPCVPCSIGCRLWPSGPLSLAVACAFSLPLRIIRYQAFALGCLQAF